VAVVYLFLGVDVHRLELVAVNCSDIVAAVVKVHPIAVGAVVPLANVMSIGAREPYGAMAIGRAPYAPPGVMNIVDR